MKWREKSWSVHYREILIFSFLLSNHYIFNTMLPLPLLGWWLLLSSSLHLLLFSVILMDFFYVFNSCWPTKWPAIGQWYACLSMPTYSTYNIWNNMNNDVDDDLLFLLWTFFHLRFPLFFLQSFFFFIE